MYGSGDGFNPANNKVNDSNNKGDSNPQENKSYTNYGNKSSHSSYVNNSSFKNKSCNGMNENMNKSSSYVNNTSFGYDNSGMRREDMFAAPSTNERLLWNKNSGMGCGNIATSDGKKSTRIYHV